MRDVENGCLRPRKRRKQFVKRDKKDISRLDALHAGTEMTHNAVNILLQVRGVFLCQCMRDVENGCLRSMNLRMQFEVRDKKE